MGSDAWRAEIVPSLGNETVPYVGCFGLNMPLVPTYFGHSICSYMVKAF